jgi:hypothetical protein
VTVTHYIIDIDSNEIINACDADRRLPDETVLRGFKHPDRLRVDVNPPLAMLKRYRYWDERP